MNLSFHKQFVPKIMDGTKKHTIREDKHSRWRAGMKIDFCTGLRTKFYKKFHSKNEVCTGTQRISILYTEYGIEAWIDKKPLTLDEIRCLYKNDGFDSDADFFKWFNKDFNGVIVHWTDLRY